MAISEMKGQEVESYP